MISAFYYCFKIKINRRKQIVLEKNSQWEVLANKTFGKCLSHTFVNFFGRVSTTPKVCVRIKLVDKLQGNFLKGKNVVELRNFLSYSLFDNSSISGSNWTQFIKSIRRIPLDAIHVTVISSRTY